MVYSHLGLYYGSAQSVLLFAQICKSHCQSFVCLKTKREGSWKSLHNISTHIHIGHRYCSIILMRIEIIASIYFFFHMRYQKSLNGLVQYAGLQFESGIGTLECVQIFKRKTVLLFLFKIFIQDCCHNKFISNVKYIQSVTNRTMAYSFDGALYLCNSLCFVLSFISAYVLCPSDFQVFWIHLTWLCTSSHHCVSVLL